VNILNSDFFVIFCSKFTCSTNVCAQMFACLAESCYGRRSWGHWLSNGIRLRAGEQHNSTSCREFDVPRCWMRVFCESSQKSRLEIYPCARRDVVTAVFDIKLGCTQPDGKSYSRVVQHAFCLQWFSPPKGLACPNTSSCYRFVIRTLIKQIGPGNATLCVSIR
jgi:hypothetical protein